MTTELWYLFLTAALLGVLWIPYIIGQVTTAGLLKPEEYRKLRNVEDAPDWVRRANRAHLNLVEQFGVFAAFVLVAHLAGISDGTTQLCAVIFFWARVAHAVVFIAGISVAMLRTLIFTVAWATLVVYGIKIAAGAM